MKEIIDLSEQATPVESVPFRGKPGALYYFAYGSNMNPEQLRVRGVKPRQVGVARLRDHEVGFYGHSRTWDGAVETVIRSEFRDVWGALYDLTYSGGDTLDGWQDARLDGSGSYFHYPTTVVDTDGITHKVLLYKKDILGPPQKPSTEYLNFIIQGAVERGLPADYIEGLRQRESRKAGFPVPVRSRFNLGPLLAADCSQCEVGVIAIPSAPKATLAT